ncbi:hypothetical protein PMAYCL1PPCAC_19805, partial [Pristionchus mayeri]
SKRRTIRSKMPYMVLGGNLGSTEAFVWTAKDSLGNVENALIGITSNRTLPSNGVCILQGSALELLNKFESRGWKIIHTCTVEVASPAGFEPSSTQYKWTLFKGTISCFNGGFPFASVGNDIPGNDIR